MDTNIIIAALRARATAFGNRVSGAAEFGQALEKDSVTAPAAWVVPLGDDASDQTMTGSRFTLTERFAVFVVVDNSADERGQAAQTDVYALRAAVWSAILGWQPSSDYDPINYEGGEPIKLDRARLFYRFEFSTKTSIETAVCRQGLDLAALPNLEKIDVRIDMIDPAADPNTPPVTDPENGGYAGGAPGPDGRIEHEASLIIPTT